MSGLSSRQFTKRDLGFAILRATVVLVVCGAPWPGVVSAWSAAHSAVANVAFDHVTFGRGGHARLRPAQGAELNSKQTPATDTMVVVTVTSHSGQLLLGVSSRRDSQLPIALMAAVLVAMPMPLVRRMAMLLFGIFLCVGASVGMLFVAVALYFAETLPAVWAPSALVLTLLRLANSVLVLPPANRFVFPLVVGVALIVLGRRKPVQLGSTGKSVRKLNRHRNSPGP